MSDTIQPINLKAAWDAQRDELEEAFRKVLGSGWYILGSQVKAFEEAFAHWSGGGETIGVANGTDAISLAVMALDIGPGDAVLTVSHTAVATVTALKRVGVKPVLVDIDPRRYTLSPDCLDRTLDEWQSNEDLRGFKPKAVMPVHLYGHPADMRAIGEIAQRHGITVIEDCAQAHGASLEGRPVGSFGRLATYSFYPTKNLGAFGDAGAVTTHDEALGERLRHLRQYGWKSRYVSDEVGMNSRLDELQAAFLLVRLEALSRENTRRREIAEIYVSGLAHLTDKGMQIPEVSEDIHHVYHQYVVRVQRRDQLQSFLGEAGVGTLIHYPVPVHLQPAYLKHSLHGPDGLPATEAAAREVLSLPMHPWLSDDEVMRVCDAIYRFYS